GRGRSHAPALVMVDRPDHPYLTTRAFRTSATTYQLHLTCPENAAGERTCHYVQVPTDTTTHSVEPDTQTPITDDNIYPQLIESDQVRAFRDRLYPHLPRGTIQSNAYGARDLTPAGSSLTASRGAFTPSRFPLIE